MKNENESRELSWLFLLMKLDKLNQRVKEPGWNYEDKQALYELKDEVMKSIITECPDELTIEYLLIPYYSYSRRSKDRAGDLMRMDPDRKPFEYYLGQIAPSAEDIEIPEKATVEINITCLGQEFSFHQPLHWYRSLGKDHSALPKKAWIGNGNFNHMFLEKMRGEISELAADLF